LLGFDGFPFMASGNGYRFWLPRSGCGVSEEVSESASSNFWLRVEIQQMLGPKE